MAPNGAYYKSSGRFIKSLLMPTFTPASHPPFEFNLVDIAAIHCTIYPLCCKTSKKREIMMNSPEGFTQ